MEERWKGKTVMHTVQMSAEHRRLEEDRAGRQPWRAWGPYLAARQWGTVREDYSLDDIAWEYLSHDQARSRAYRWGEASGRRTTRAGPA
jgi:hypothetical protein